MNLSRIVQEDDTGCGIACVAIVAGMEYQETKSVFIQEVFAKKRRKYWTYFRHVEKGLEALGISSHRRKFTDWKDFSGTAIIPIDRDKRSRNFHWVVAHRSGNHIHLMDPEEFLPRRRVRFGRPKVRGLYIQIESPVSEVLRSTE